MTPRKVNAHVVIIEWDGQKPPTRYYNRLARLVAGNEDVTTGAIRGKGHQVQDVIERRTLADNPGGIVAQEGCVICMSESLALQIASYVKHEIAPGMEKPVTVAIGKVELDYNLSMSAELSPVFARAEEVMAKRGRRAKAQPWVVTCRECLTASPIMASQPLNCPHCGGLRIHSRKGQPVRYHDTQDPILTFWARTRFSGPAFEPAEIAEDWQDAQAPREFADLDAIDASEKVDQAFKAIAQSDLPAVLEGMDRATAIAVLDAIFTAKAYYSPEARQTARVTAVAKYFEKHARSGIAPRMVSIAEIGVDLLDVALIMGADRAVELMMSYAL